MPTIRIWNGAKVVQVISVDETGSSTVGSVGGAENSTLVDIEMDPWKGLIVDHDTRNGPLNWRAEQD